jgi:transaldolase
VDRVASVASFFVSRVDTNIDARLDKLAQADPARAPHYQALRGQAAVANSKLAYRQFEEKFSGPRWEKLAAAGAHVQRPLWASTGVKNPAYPDLLYVDPLIGPHTVNTMPPATVVACLDHATVARTVDQGVDEARALLAAVEEAGISLDEVTEELEADGVQKFADSFVQLLAAIEAKRREVVAG